MTTASRARIPTRAPRLQALGLSVLWAALPLLGCGAGEQPAALEQLELRDALLADPAVIAALPQATQQRLAGRFWSAMALPGPVQSAALPAPLAPDQRLRSLDAQRQQQGQDAFLVGQWAQSAAVQTLTPFYRPARSAPSSTLPALASGQSGVATATAANEARALAGRAGATIEDLLKYGGLLQLERVTGWPTAVVAIEDRLYVNAAWLTAVAALEPGEPLGVGAGGPTFAKVGGLSSVAGFGGSVIALTSDQPPDQHTQALTDGTTDPTAAPNAAAAASGSSGCDSSSCNSCSSSSSSCNSSSTSSSNCSPSCADAADHQCCRACAITKERSGPDLSMLLVALWMCAPLAWLAGVDLRARSVAKRHAKT